MKFQNKKSKLNLVKIDENRSEITERAANFQVFEKILKNF